MCNNWEKYFWEEEQAHQNSIQKNGKQNKKKKKAHKLKNGL